MNIIESMPCAIYKELIKSAAIDLRRIFEYMPVYNPNLLCLHKLVLHKRQGGSEKSFMPGNDLSC